MLPSSASDWGAALACAAASPCWWAAILPACCCKLCFSHRNPPIFLHCPALQPAMPHQSPTARRRWCWRRGGRCGSTACRWWGGCWGLATRRGILGTSPQHPHSPFQRPCSTQVGCWAGGGGAWWGLGPGAQRPAPSAHIYVANAWQMCSVYAILTDLLPALCGAGLSRSDVEYWEVNEAFSVVDLANQQLLSLDPDR